MRPGSLPSRIRDRIVSADTIYGTILFAALIAASSNGNGSGDGIPGDVIRAGAAAALPAVHADQADLAETLVVAVVTLLVFWLAHVYARTIAGHGARMRLRTAIRTALGNSAGMLYAAIPSTIVLILGVVTVLPDAADWSLVVAVVVLGILGYQSFAERGSRIVVRIVGGLSSALLGLALMVLDIIVH